MRKDQQVFGNMLMFHVDVKQGLVLKMTCFNDSESIIYLRDGIFIHGFKTLRDVFIHCVTHFNFQKHIIGAL